ncbi:serine protease [Flavivirga spongiicola]
MIILLGQLNNVHAQNKESSKYDHYYNDGVITSSITKKGSELIKAGNFVEMDKLRIGLNKSSENVKLPITTSKGRIDLDATQDGILILVKLYLCGHCPNHHASIATGFVLNKEGVCATNHHVFAKDPKESIDYVSVFAIDNQGNTYPVVEVLAANKDNDLALFKIEPQDEVLKPVFLGENAKVADNVHIISHPKFMFYTYSRGFVKRSYLSYKEGAPRQSISANFDPGSSGAPVFNDSGDVVGVVTSVMTVYDKENKNAKIEIREMIPIDLLKQMCRGPL